MNNIKEFYLQVRVRGIMEDDMASCTTFNIRNSADYDIFLNKFEEFYGNAYDIRVFCEFLDKNVSNRAVDADDIESVISNNVCEILLTCPDDLYIKYDGKRIPSLRAFLDELKEKLWDEGFDGIIRKHLKRREFDDDVWTDISDAIIDSCIGEYYSNTFFGILDNLNNSFSDYVRYYPGISKAFTEYKEDIEKYISSFYRSLSDRR